MHRISREARGTRGTRGFARSLRAGVVAVAALTLVFAMSASAADPIVTHGITPTKGCVSPTKIGDPYTCSFTIRNNVDEAHDTLTIHSLVDVVKSAGGNVSSGNILSSVGLVLSGGATCIGGAGAGTIASPYVGATECTLPSGARIDVRPTSHYTVQAADFGLSGHQLKDDVSIGWHDLCDDLAGTGNSNCNANPPNVNASSLTVVQQLAATVTTVIHNPAHQVVTSVEAGKVVHDFVKVTGEPGRRSRPATSSCSGSPPTARARVRRRTRRATSR